MKIFRTPSVENFAINVVVALIFLVVGAFVQNQQSTASAFWLDILMAVAICCICLLVMLIVLHLRADIALIAERNKAEIISEFDERRISVRWCSDFEETSRLVDAAKEYIVVATAIGNHADNIPQTDSRSSYLEKITDKIRKDPNFRYLRFMPSHNYSEIMSGSLQIIDCDAAAAGHLRSVADAMSHNSEQATNVSIKISPPIALLPSTIIIDGKHMCFALPQKLARPTKNGINTVIKDVIVISDPSGTIPTKMKTLIEAVADKGDDILFELEKYIGIEISDFGRADEAA